MVMGVTVPAWPTNAQRRKPFRLFAFLVSALLLLILAFVLADTVPFSEQRVIRELQEASDSTVTVREFRHTYFPEPGCVLSGVVFTHGHGSSKLLITIEKLIIQSMHFEILVSHVSLVQAEGLRISIPAIGSGEPFHTQASSLTLGKVVANEAILEIALHDSQTPPLKFDIHEAILNNVKSGQPFAYHFKVHNPEPPGEVTAEGEYGAWNANDPAQTRISGHYSLDHTDLGVYHGVAGILSSSGRFSGTLGRIDMSGVTEAPAFVVTSGGHPVRLTSDFSAYVDAIHGDIFLKHVDARWRKTHVVTEGSISGSPNGQAKTATLSLHVSDGRIEDVLGLFVQANRPPMSGKLDLYAKVQIPSDSTAFLRRVKLNGTFGVAGGEFSEPSTQENVNKLSAGALGEKDISDPDTVLTGLKGQVILRDGLASFNDLSFGVPGASARMRGTYNILNYQIDLHGQMQVLTKISNTKTGAEALLLRVLNPFFKKRKKGEILPVKVTGTYQKPSFGLDLADKKAQVGKSGR